MKEHDVKHYEFVPDDTMEIEPGKVLHRIRATTHIEAHGFRGCYLHTIEDLQSALGGGETSQRYASGATTAMTRSCGSLGEGEGRW